MRRTWVPLCVVSLVALASAAACTEGPIESTSTTTSMPAVTTPPSTDDAAASSTTVASDGSVVSAQAGKEWAFGTVPDRATPADASLDPLVVGIINQENVPIGSFPEMRLAAQSAFDWINAELGGVNGRPIEVVTCIANFSVEQSQACAQQMVQAGAVAVISGIDISSNGSVPVFEQNGIAMLSAIPTTLAELRSPIAFSFSGGITGAYVAFVADAHEKGATSIAIGYGDYESFAVPATSYAAPVAESLGMKVTLIPFPITTNDFLPVVQAAVDSGADAIAVAAADSSCVPLMTTLHDLGYQGLPYIVGACAAAQILQQVPDEIQAPIIFNTEGPPGPSVDGQLFLDATARYTTGAAGGAGTVAFRTAMNLWHVMEGLGTDVTSAGILDALRASKDAPSFWGHPYTCDGNQVTGLPALCSPQQTTFRLPDDSGNAVPESTDWIDVPALVRGIG